MMVKQFHDRVAFKQISFTPTTDDELAAAASFDEAAFAELINRHRARVARLVHRFFQQPDEIEEITHLSFIEAWRAIDSYQPRQDSSFAAWLARIAINTCYDEWRKRRRRRESAFSQLGERDTLFISSINGSPPVRVERELISRDLATKLLAMLEPDDRRVFILLKAENLSVAEIATATGWTPTKVKMRIHRTKSLLRRKSRRLI